MSEVIGYILGFFMSFVLLLTTLTAFNIQADKANNKALSAHFDDIANRVARTVLGAVDVGIQRAKSETTSPSEHLVYYERIRIPTQIRGQQYTINLDATEVTVSANKLGISETAALFNLQVPATCAHTSAVCSVSGSSPSSLGHVLVKYEYMRGPMASPTTNAITIG